MPSECSPECPGELAGSDTGYGNHCNFARKHGMRLNPGECRNQLLPIPVQIPVDEDGARPVIDEVPVKWFATGIVTQQDSRDEDESRLECFGMGVRLLMCTVVEDRCVHGDRDPAEDVQFLARPVRPVSGYRTLSEHLRQFCLQESVDQRAGVLRPRCHSMKPSPRCCATGPQSVRVVAGRREHVLMDQDVVGGRLCHLVRSALLRDRMSE